jgi:hypothetical protein
VPGWGGGVRAVLRTARAWPPGHHGWGREARVDADPAAADARARVVAVAVAVLQQHRADRDGWCRGCVEEWGRLAPHPCTQATWAAAVYAAYADTAEQPTPPTGQGSSSRHEQVPVIREQTER